MPWKKGESGNLRGRPLLGQGEIEKLRKAMREVESEIGDGFTFYRHFCQRAAKDDTVLAALMKKILPDLRQVDQTVDLQGQYGVIAFPTKLPVGAECKDEELDLGKIKD